MSVTLTAGATETAPALELRPWQAQDAAALVAAFGDQAMGRFLITRIEDEAQALRWIEAREQEWLTGSRLSFAIEEDVGRGPVGYIAVKGLHPGGTSGEVGYWTVAAARGRRVASRALQVVADWVLESRLEELELLHSTTNPASCAVARNCGFPLRAELPPEPPAFPDPGHLHVRVRRWDGAEFPAVPQVPLPRGAGHAHRRAGRAPPQAGGDRGHR
jgi:RimJ/RimL family protein N-acetyltransferase